MPYQVAVCGPAECTAAEWTAAHRVGRLLAEQGAVVLCGGGAGVMAAVAAGARSAGGVVVGIRPDDARVDDAGPDASGDLTAVVVTNMGQARNAVIVQSADAVIVVGGSWGTLSEVALAKRRGGVRVVSLGGWRVVDAGGTEIPGLDHVATPDDAVRLACSRST